MLLFSTENETATGSFNVEATSHKVQKVHSSIHHGHRAALLALAPTPRANSFNRASTRPRPITKQGGRRCDCEGRIAVNVPVGVFFQERSFAKGALGVFSGNVLLGVFCECSFGNALLCAFPMDIPLCASVNGVLCVL